MNKPRLLPPTYAIIILIVGSIIHSILPVTQLVPGELRVFGIFPILLGMALTLWANSLFKKYETTIKPYEQSSALIIQGPFQMSRNPMYLGGLIAFLGLAWLLGSITAFGMPVIYFYVINSQFIPVEEKQLEEAFGDAYREYKRRVRRWI